MTVRLRTAAKTVPGNYSVTITLEDNGQDISTTYYFRCCGADGLLRRDSYPSPIPGQEAWESNMTQFGHKYCDDAKYKRLAGSSERGRKLPD